MPAERVRLRIGNLAKAVLVSGQTYQDPKDALNEFVSNAADEYIEAGRRGERVRVVLRRKGRSPVIAVDDLGRGMSPDRLRDIARNLFESAKADDDRTLGCCVSSPGARWSTTCGPAAAPRWRAATT